MFRIKLNNNTIIDLNQSTGKSPVVTRSIDSDEDQVYQVRMVFNHGFS